MTLKYYDSDDGDDDYVDDDASQTLQDTCWLVNNALQMTLL
jgi:hypothetical protein